MYARDRRRPCQRPRRADAILSFSSAVLPDRIRPPARARSRRRFAASGRVVAGQPRHLVVSLPRLDLSDLPTLIAHTTAHAEAVAGRPIHRLPGTQTLAVAVRP